MGRIARAAIDAVVVGAVLAFAVCLAGSAGAELTGGKVVVPGLFTATEAVFRPDWGVVALICVTAAGVAAVRAARRP